MAVGQVTSVLDQLRRTVFLRATDRMSDAELLDAFLATQNEAAFEGIIRRHGAMVYGVCRRVLGNPHDAEDAFQAAFLVLARKAATVQPRELLGNWLYGVAYRTALKARSMIAKRQAREKQVHQMPECAAPPETAWSDLQPLVDQELNRLGDKYRVPVVLCDLEGKSQRAAARQLGWPEGTLMTRLARARRLLAKRLSRRGVALSAGALATLLTHNGACAAVPATLTATTVKAAALVAAGQAATTLISAEVAVLTEGVLRTMLMSKVKSATIVLFVTLVLGSGAGLFTPWSQTDRSWAAAPGAVPQRPIEEANFTSFFEQERGRPDPNAANLRGKIVAVAEDGKSLTLETVAPPANRGEEPVKNQVSLKINDKTELKFFGVALDGAKLSEGMLAQVWTTAGARDVATKIQIGSGRENRLGPDVSGKVTNLSKDGTTLTLEIGRGESGKTVEVKLTVGTVLTYSGVVQGGTRPTVGYTADVWLERASKTDAAAINFRAGGRAAESGRGTGQAAINGTLVAIGNDGKLLTVQKPAQERGGQAERVEIKITDKTRITYNNITADGAKLTEGSTVHVLLVEGSSDTAASVTVTPQKGKVKERFQTVRGQVVSVGKDGKSFTIELPRERAQPAEQVTIKIMEHTRVLFNGVGSGGARLTPGHSASVTLDEGSRNAAFLVVFAPVEPGRR